MHPTAVHRTGWREHATIVFLVSLLLGLFLIGCGGGGENQFIGPNPPPVQTQSFAFLTGTTTEGVFTPMLGTFNGDVYTSDPVKDPSTGQPMQGLIYSISLSSDGKS